MKVEVRFLSYFHRTGGSAQPEKALPETCCEGRLEWVPYGELLQRPMPHTAYYTIRHYLETGRHTDVLYAGATREDEVVFSPLNEF